MDNQISEISHCPKCGARQRIATSGTDVGLEVYTGSAVVLVCLSCSYIEFYATSKHIEMFNERLSRAARKKANAESRARKEEQEQRDRAEKPKKRRFF